MYCTVWFLRSSSGSPQPCLTKIQFPSVHSPKTRAAPAAVCTGGASRAPWLSLGPRPPSAVSIWSCWFPPHLEASRRSQFGRSYNWMCNSYWRVLFYNKLSNINFEELHIYKKVITWNKGHFYFIYFITYNGTIMAILSNILNSYISDESNYLKWNVIYILYTTTYLLMLLNISSCCSISEFSCNSWSMYAWISSVLARGCLLRRFSALVSHESKVLTPLANSRLCRSASPPRT